MSDSQAQAYLEKEIEVFANNGFPLEMAVDTLRDACAETNTVHPQMVYLIPFADGSWIVSTRNPDDLAHCSAMVVDSAGALTETLQGFGNRAGGEGLESAIVAVPRNIIADAARSSEPLTLEQITAYSKEGDTGNCASCPIRHICPTATPTPADRDDEAGGRSQLDMAHQAVAVERLLGDLRIDLN